MQVNGKNCVLYINVDDVWTPYACARSLSFTTSTELIETSVTGSGLNATYLPTKNTASGSAEGVASLEEMGFITLPDLRTLQITQQVVNIRYDRTDQGGNLYREEMNVYLTNVSDPVTFDGMLQFTFDFTVTGSITRSTIPFARFRAREEALGNPLNYLFYLEGEPEAGDEVTVHLKFGVTEEDFTYTVLLGDEIEDIIDALFALIDAYPGSIIFVPTNLTTGLLIQNANASSCSVEITL